MSTPAVPLPGTGSEPSVDTGTAPAGAPGRRRQAVLAGAALVAGGAAWVGGVWGVAFAILAAALAALARGTAAFAPGPGPGDDPARVATPAAAARPAVSAHTGNSGRRGTEVMVSQIVPIWARQMEVTREAANEGVAKLLETFAGFSSAIGELEQGLGSLTSSATPGAVDEAVNAQMPALDKLLEPSRRAFSERDETIAVLARCGETMAELGKLAKQSREIARHTRLVALNASIEAQRGHNGPAGGSQSVAGEVRMLADRMAATGEAIDRLVGSVAHEMEQARRRGELHDTSPTELQLELELKAREALQALLGALGTSLGGSSAVRALSSQLREQVDNAFIHFQFGDRLSQMLAIVANDMNNFVTWVDANPLATQSDAAQWLQALEASYTMDEQRAHHHGNVHIERESEVEFF